MSVDIMQMRTTTYTNSKVLNTWFAQWCRTHGCVQVQMAVHTCLHMCFCICPPWCVRMYKCTCVYVVTSENPASSSCGSSSLVVSCSHLARLKGAADCAYQIPTASLSVFCHSCLMCEPPAGDSGGSPS